MRALAANVGPLPQHSGYTAAWPEADPWRNSDILISSGRRLCVTECSSWCSKGRSVSPYRPRTSVIAVSAREVMGLGQVVECRLWTVKGSETPLPAP